MFISSVERSFEYKRIEETKWRINDESPGIEWRGEHTKIHVRSSTFNGFQKLKSSDSYESLANIYKLR